ncbi:hypothetical protein BU16DRAFT_568252 [Lophium mytilinum]|uniref:Uncharacterized protein n=1 Tax=Lophium mytilinum TaxID=390894 RepID=A0A6A6Q8G6_9PEZI|nr:hypothetical protein BU16DRAFT_568252 [Lophium mytilinum]
MSSYTNLADKATTDMNIVADVKVVAQRERIAVKADLSEANSNKPMDNGPIDRVSDTHTSFHNAAEDDLGNPFPGEDDTTLVEKEDITSSDIYTAGLDKTFDKNFGSEEFVKSAGLSIIAPPRGRAKSILRSPSWIVTENESTSSRPSASIPVTPIARSTSNGTPSKKRKRVSFHESATVVHIDRTDVTEVEQLPVDKLGVRSGHFLKHQCVELPEEIRERVKRARDRSPHPVLQAQRLREESTLSNGERSLPTSMAIAHRETLLDETPLDTPQKRRRMRSPAPSPPTPSSFGPLKDESFTEASHRGRPKGLPSDIRKMIVPKLQPPRPSKRVTDPKKRRAQSVVLTTPAKHPFEGPLGVGPDGNPIAPAPLQNAMNELHEAQHTYEEAMKTLETAKDMKKKATERALNELKVAHEAYGEPQNGFYYPLRTDLVDNVDMSDDE